MGKRVSGSVAARKAGRRTSDPVASLAGSIAHDFSNLLMIIRNAGAFLQEELESGDPRQVYVSDLLAAAERATALTRQLQAMGGSQLLNPELVRPAEIVRAMADTLRRLVPEDVEFEISVRDPDARVVVDVAQLQFVILNLLTYAAEGLGSHGRLMLVVREQLFVHPEPQTEGAISGRFVSIAVARSGDGVGALEKSEVFAPRLTSKTLPRGTDLRLASVHGIVTQSGGFVDVVTEGGKSGGTTIKVCLPLAAEEEYREHAPAHIKIHKDVSGDEVILLVEDDEGVRGMVRDSLERYGYTIIEAADGAEALRLMRLFNTLPDLMLTDLVMPNMTGRELIEALTLEGRLPRTLLMSGYTGDEVLRRTKPSDAFLFIRKPFTHNELAAKVREALGSTESGAR